MSPLEIVLNALRQGGCEPRLTGGQWSALCPAHQDRRPSLSVTLGSRGEALVHCFAGCTPADVVDRLGLRMSDLFPESVAKTPRQTRQTGVMATGTPRARPSRAKTPRVYATAREAVSTLERRLGMRSAMWTYHSAEGEPVGVIVRWDLPGGKEIRPVSRRSGGWVIGAMPSPRPLYGLPELSGAPRVYICEGEKASDAARSLGLVATTSAHGARSARLTDWSPLAGRECILLPDNDEAGERYVVEVLSCLARLRPGVLARVVHLPGLPEGGDLADLVLAGVTDEP